MTFLVINVETFLFTILKSFSLSVYKSQLKLLISRVPKAVHRVEKWLEDLHDERRAIELSFRARKTQLEQCLALALLASDLRELEDILSDRVAALKGASDHLGDSTASTETLLHELRKLQLEAKVSLQFFFFLLFFYYIYKLSAVFISKLVPYVHMRIIEGINFLRCYFETHNTLIGNEICRCNVALRIRIPF